MSLFGNIYNNLLKRVFLFLLFSMLTTSLSSQDIGEVETDYVFVSDYSLSLFITTSGGGIGYQHGWTPTYRVKHALDIDFLYTNHEKAVKGTNYSYEGARAYSYGKLYDLFFLRTGYTYQRTTHHKPYWGGVDIGYFLSGGFSLGIAMPTYLEIAYLSPSGHDIISLIERYDPAIHDLSNIIGGVPFYERFHQLTFRPGVFGKAGLIFDFSRDKSRIRALEFGLFMDAIFPPIQQMAFNNAKPLFFGGYISYKFGKKKELYE